MMTQTGRVVYDRKEHPFSTKDIARIITSLADSDDWADRGKIIAEVQIEMILSKEAGWIAAIRLIISSLFPVARYYQIGIEKLMEILNSAVDIILAQGTQEEWYV